MRRFLPPLILGATVFLALTAIRWLLRPEPPAPPRPVVLSFARMLGCWELDAGEWEFSPATGSSDAPEEVAPDPASGALLEIPDRILLLPDSIDEWRRPFTTYRAAPVAGGHDPRLRDYLRWFPRADTLWLVWSDRRVRAGLALLAGGGILKGGGRAMVRSGAPGEADIDGRVSVTAWKVNCATGLRDLPREGPRR